MRKRVGLALAALALAAAAAAPGAAIGQQQTFWTLSTGQLPEPLPTAVYPMPGVYGIYPLLCGGRPYVYSHGRCIVHPRPPHPPVPPPTRPPIPRPPRPPVPRPPHPPPPRPVALTGR